MNSLPQTLKQHNAKCTHIWPIAFRVPNALKATNGTPNKRENGTIQSEKHLFKTTQTVPATQKSAPAQPGPASKAPTKSSLLTKSP
jgi:hypothetical protein